jgi:flagellar hook-associated protein 2
VGNTLGDDVTGLTGVTLDLKNTTTGSVAINVDRDKGRLSNAMKDIVDQFNNLINIIDTETKAKDGRLGANNSIRGFRNNIRQLMSSSSGSATVYNSLSLVGIGSSNSAGLSASATMSFDSAKFFEALGNNPSDVEALFTGADGIFTRLQTVVDQSVETSGIDSEAGLFQSIDNSFNNSIERYNDNISRGEERLERRRIALQRQFAASDSLIAQYQSQGQAISGLANQISANNR